MQGSHETTAPQHFGQPCWPLHAARPAIQYGCNNSKRFAKNPTVTTATKGATKCETSYHLSANVLVTALGVALLASPASAQKKYDNGATDTEIKIGNTNALQRAGLGLWRDRQGRSRPT